MGEQVEVSLADILGKIFALPNEHHDIQFAVYEIRRAGFGRQQGKLACPKCDGADIIADGLRADEIAAIFDKCATQFGYVKSSPCTAGRVPSDDSLKAAIFNATDVSGPVDYDEAIANIKSLLTSQKGTV